MDSDFAVFYAALARDEGGEAGPDGATPPAVLRVFTRGGGGGGGGPGGRYFTVHGRTALWVADTHFGGRKDVVKQKAGLDYANLSLNKLRDVLADALVARKLRAELYERADGAYRMAARGSPGNMQDFEPLLAPPSGPGAAAGPASGASASGATASGASASASASAASSCIMAVLVAPSDGVGATPGQRVVGVAFADAERRVLEVGEFVDDGRFTSLRAAVAQHGARECVMQAPPKSSGAGAGRAPAVVDGDGGGDDDGEEDPGDGTEHGRLAAVMAECGVAVAHRKAGEFARPEPGAGGRVEQDLRRMVGHLQQQFVLLERRTALGALGALIRYAELARDEAGHGRWTLGAFDLGDCMRLDAAAMAALNLFPAATDSARSMSLFGLLDKCRSASGSRLLSRWIKQPLLDMDALRRRHDAVEALVADDGLRHALREEHLKGVPDLSRVARTFQRRRGGLELLVKVYGFLVRVPVLVDALRRYEGEHAALVRDEIGGTVERLSRDFANLENMVEATVDLDALKRREYVVNPRFTPALERLAAKKVRTFDDMEGLARDVADDVALDAKAVRLMHGQAHGYHLRVTRKDEKSLRGKGASGAGIVRLETKKDGVHFTTAPLRELSRRYESLCRQYDEIQREIVDKCMEVVVTYTPVMERLDRALSELDVLAAFAHVSASAPVPYARPEMRPLGSGVLELRGARHPCVEVQDGVQFIANDVVMRRGSTALQVITGPNMGGKSTYIRQAGVAVLMAQIGCFVPCESAVVSAVDCILARVGAGDSQLRGVSTFMKEMLEASSILRSSTENSLLIIDELGRGTSTYDGFGLAWAIAEHIAREVRCLALFATHFHELTALASSVPGAAVNKHVTAYAGDGTITMLYKVRDGPCDRSFGIHVSEIAQFPPSVVEMARRKAAELEDFGSSAASGVGAAAAAATEPVASPGGTKRARDGGETPPAKRARVADDEDAAQRLLRAFAALPIDKLDEADASRRLLQFREEMRSEGLLA